MKNPFAILLLLLPMTMSAGRIEYTLVKSESDLCFSKSSGFDVVDLAGGHFIPDTGAPFLPLVNVTLLLPPDARITRVSATPLSSVEIPGTYTIIPAQRPLPVGTEPGAMVSMSRSVYGSDESYPRTVLQHAGDGNASGFRLASVVVAPLQYRPLSGRLTLHTRIRIAVEFDHSGDASPITPTQARLAAASLTGLIANPEDLTRFSPGTAGSDLPEVNLLVITANRLAGHLRPFLDMKNQRGFRAEIRTTEWANLNYPGRDLQERLRNMIRDFFERRGTSFVLLAGDNAQIPCRRIRLDVFDEQGDIPTDLYYGDLDYSWDSNRNNLFGEMDDSVDLFADVFVARASVENATEIQTFIDKVNKYDNDPAPDYIRRSLLPSGWLWRSLGYHGRFMNDSIANITPAGWTDRSLVNPPSLLVVRDSFEHGFNIFNPAGHGNATGVYDENGTPIYTTGAAGAQRNDRRFAVSTSLACDPGNFEWEDCLAEVTHNCPNGGSIAVMMNSRYGWGTPPSIGPSELLCIRFYDFLLNRQVTNVATCHDRSREVYAVSARYSTLWRWCMTEFNLFCDPTLDIWTDSPEQLVITSPDTITTGNTAITVLVEDGNGPVPGARVCAWMEPDVHAVDFTCPSGRALLTVHPHCSGTLRLTASCHNRLPATKDVVVTPGDPEPFIIFARASVSDHGSPEPNGILEPGETGQVSIVLWNAGTVAATNTSLLIRPCGTGLLLHDSTAALGNINPSDSATTPPLSLSVSPDILPGSSPEISGFITSDQGTWEFAFTIQIGHPGRISAEIDTGACALTVTARGLLGFDTEAGNRSGRGFRFPQNDTTSLNTATFSLATSPDYVADRFYNRQNGFDRDWKLYDSVRLTLPLWNADQTLKSAFSDAGHPAQRNLLVRQHSLGFHDGELAGSVILVYDITNLGASLLSGAHAGVLADFDVKATDRLHDIAGTVPDLNTAYMRSITVTDRVVGVKLLAPTAPAHLACLDHARYIYPDSGLSESMKFRVLTGGLGSSQSDRPFNWSVSVSVGPFDIPPAGGRQRVAFALIAAVDSVSYLNACQTCQEWYDANVGLAMSGPDVHSKPLVTLAPCPFTRELIVKCRLPQGIPVSIRAYDPAGRLTAAIHEGPIPADGMVTWRPDNITPGVYFVQLLAPGRCESQRVVLAR